MAEPRRGTPPGLDPELRESTSAFRDGSWRIRRPVHPHEVAEEIAQ